MNIIEESNNGNIKYLFGDQLFLGYIKFYAEQREFGYLTSNNWRMNSNEIFRKRFQDFYIDKASFEEDVEFNQLVVFRPAYADGKLKAMNLFQYRKDIHSEIAINTILGDPFIHLEKRHRITVPAGRSSIRYDYHTSQQEINIFSLSGIQRFKLIERCCEIYEDKGSEALLYALDSFVSAVGGDYQYSWKLHKEYVNKDIELNAIKNMFILIDSLTAQKIILKHASLQFLAPHSVLLALAGKLNDKFAIPSEVMEEHRVKKLQCIIEGKRVFQQFYDEKKVSDIYCSKEDIKREQRRFLHMLNYCPENIKESLANEINKQIREGIQLFLSEIENKTRLEKKHLLEYCSDYIDDNQKALIEKSFEIDDAKDYLKRLNSNLRLTFSYYPLDFNLNSITKNFYQQRIFIRNGAKPILADAILQKIDNKLNVAYANNYDEIIDTVNSNKFILEECHDQAISLIRNKFRAFCEKELFSRHYSDKLPIIMNKLFEQEEVDILLNSYSKKILSIGSLSVIHRFFNVFGLTYPITYCELIRSRDLAGLLDCGDFFSNMPDYGCSLLDVVFDKIRDNTNGNGDFLTDYNIQSDRCCFLVRLINTITDKDSIRNHIMTLSNHDRIVLTLSRKIEYFPGGGRFVKDGFDNDFLTIDDVKKELQSIGAEGNNDDILQILPQSCIAIAEIILSSECKTEADLHNVLLWLRKYYTIENRKYKDRDERNYYEDKLLMYFANLERSFHVDVKNYGIDLENNLFPLSYGDYELFKPIIVNLAKAKVENCNSHLVINIPKDTVADDSIRYIIEKLFETSLEIREDNVCLIINMEDNLYTSTTILSYITLNILNNLHLIMTNKIASDIIPFNNYKMISYITSIFNMEYNAGGTTITRFKWDGSEDRWTDWKHIVIKFDVDIDEVTKSILLKVEPNLESNNKTLEYHDGIDCYKGHYGCGPIGEMTIRLFKAYKERILITTL